MKPLRKRQFQFSVIYCQLQNLGYKRCDFPKQDCRKCVVGQRFKRVKGYYALAENLAEDAKAREVLSKMFPYIKEPIETITIQKAIRKRYPDFERFL